MLGRPQGDRGRLILARTKPVYEYGPGRVRGTTDCRLLPSEGVHEKEFLRACSVPCSAAGRWSDGGRAPLLLWTRCPQGHSYRLRIVGRGERTETTGEAT